MKQSGTTVLSRLIAVVMALLLSACAASQLGDVSTTSTGTLPALALQGPVGLPPAKTQVLGNGLADALREQGVSLAPTSESPARFKMKGVCSASPGGGNTSVVCVWDMIEPAGQRAHRIITEDTVRGSQPASPWAVVDNAALGQIAQGVAGKTAAWLPNAPAEQTFRLSIPGLSGLSSRPTISVTGVNGAPGSGNNELAAAMRGALRAQNVVVSTSANSAYRVAGQVSVSSAGRAEDQVVIEWTLTDTQGASLGDVTQRNRVPKGALSRAWGVTARDAATAAARGIVQLLP